MPVTEWIHESDPVRLRRLGKTGEELGEAMAVVSRCIIQGIDEIDPSSGKTNRLRLEEELADVLAQIECTVDAFGLRTDFIKERGAKKVEQMAVWEGLMRGDAF